MDSDRTNGGAPEVAALTCANEDTFEPTWGPVRRLLLYEGATRVIRASETDKTDELWQGDAYDPARPGDTAIPIYFRIGTTQALAAELVCGCLAQQLNLPAPEVFVLSVPKGSLSGSKLVRRGQGTICVATRDLGGETFNQFLNANADAAVCLLRNWPELGKVIAFDEWTANIDRNLDNIIYSAETLHIIDHAEAFGGQVRLVMELGKLTTMHIVNKLAGVLNQLNAKARNAILNDLHAWLGDMVTGMDVGSAVTRACTSEWHSPAQDAELIDFLQQRLPITHALLCQQLGHPQLTLKA